MVTAVVMDTLITLTFSMVTRFHNSYKSFFFVCLYCPMRLLDSIMNWGWDFRNRLTDHLPQPDTVLGV